MAVDGPVGDGETRAVELVDQLVAAEEAPGRARQRGEQGELADRQRHFAALPARAPPLAVEAEAAAFERRGRRWCRCAARGRAAQDRPGAGHDLAGGEGLDHIVVAAQLDPQHAVDLVVAAGQEQDRGVALAAQSAADFQSVHARHGDIQHDQVGRMGGGLCQCLLAIPRLDHRHPGLVEREGQDLADMRVVIDQEHGAGHGGHCHCSSAPVNPGAAGAASTTGSGSIATPSQL